MTKTATEILSSYEEKNEFHFHEVDKTWIVEAMQEYAEQECDTIQNLYEDTLKQLKPLEDLWRKENSPDRFVLPDATEFYKWIVNKIITK